MNPPTVLVLGARGRFGSAAATAFESAGWHVIRQARSGACALPLTDTGGLAAAAAGARVVVHAVNPLYTRWDAEMLPLARAGMAVAQALGATFLLPGNVYSYGERMPERLGTDTPHEPTTAKGRLRLQLEDELAARAGSGMLRSVIVRAGDFYGHGRGNWFDQAIVKSLAKGRLVYPGPLDVPHAWAYLPDFARAVVAAVSAAALPPHLRLHFGGHTLTGAELLHGLDSAARALGIPGPLRRRRLHWAPLRVAGLVVPMLRELARMAYLWRVPHALDGRSLHALVGPLPTTPLPTALRAALADLGHGEPAARRAALAEAAAASRSTDAAGGGAGRATLLPSTPAVA